MSNMGEPKPRNLKAILGAAAVGIPVVGGAALMSGGAEALAQYAAPVPPGTRAAQGDPNKNSNVRLQFINSTEPTPTPTAIAAAEPPPPSVAPAEKPPASPQIVPPANYIEGPLNPTSTNPEYWKKYGNGQQPPHYPSPAEEDAKRKALEKQIADADQKLRTIDQTPLYKAATATAVAKQTATANATATAVANKNAQPPPQQPPHSEAPKPSAPAETTPSSFPDFGDLNADHVAVHNKGTKTGVIPGDFQALANAAKQFAPNDKFEIDVYDDPNKVPSAGPQPYDTTIQWGNGQIGKQLKVNVGGVWQWHVSLPQGVDKNTIDRTLAIGAINFFIGKDQLINQDPPGAAEARKQQALDPFNGQGNFPIKVT